MHETTNARIEALKPQHLQNKTAMEIVAYLRSHFKTDFVADGKGMRQVPQNKSTAYMIAVSKALFDPQDWKNPFKAFFPLCGNEWAKAAIIWYHACEPIDRGFWVYSRGYAC